MYDQLCAFTPKALSYLDDAHINETLCKHCNHLIYYHIDDIKKDGNCASDKDVYNIVCPYCSTLIKL